MPDYENQDSEDNPFEIPDYGNQDPDYNPFEMSNDDIKGDENSSIINSEINENLENEANEPFKNCGIESESEKQTEGNVNPNNSDTVTVVELEQSEQGSDQISEQKSDHDLEEILEEFELVTPEGEPVKSGESLESLQLRAELEELGLAENTEPYYSSEEIPEIKSNHDLKQEPSQNNEVKSEIELEVGVHQLSEQ